jgi:hypothetical protein
MLENFRDFQARDPFGELWQVAFLWLQTAISIRHSDSVDVKFALSNAGQRTEKVIALMHPDLLVLSRKTGRPITDPWCSRLAALHLVHMLETGEDMEKTLVTAHLEELESCAAQLERQAAAV